MQFVLLRIFGILLQVIIPVTALLPYPGRPPQTLPSRRPFGFANNSTGGADFNSSTYFVTNATDLRVALTLPYPKVVYVKGTIYGNELDNGSFADCQWYVNNP